MFLSLNQGTEGVRGGLDVLHKRAIDLRRAAGHQTDLMTQIDLRSTNLRPKKYEAGSAYALRYERGAIPSEEKLAADLHRMLSMLEAVTITGLGWHPVNEPVHLVLQWDTNLEARAPELHRSIADDQGSVWWGRFAASTKPSVAPRRLAQLQQQLAEGVETHAYLYRRDALWRVSVAEATVKPPDSRDPRFPSYYNPQDCNFFIRLRSDFLELPADWLLGNAVLASQPEERPDRLASALNSQTNPLFVLELALAGTETGLSSLATVADDEAVTSAVTLSEICRRHRGATSGGWS